MPIVAEKYQFVIGVDTHAASHSFAVIAPATTAVGQEAQFPATAAGLSRAVAWAGRHAGSPDVALVVVEGIGSYGAGVARAFTAAGYRIVEGGAQSVGDRRGTGKSDALDAVRIARSVIGTDTAQLREPRADGTRNALRILIISREMMTRERTATVNALTALVRTTDLGLDARKALTIRQLRIIAAWRARTGDAIDVAVARAEATRLARHALELGTHAAANARQLDGLVRQVAPDLLDKRGVGPVTAAVLVVSWSHHGRVRSEAAFAALAGTCPIPASSVNTTRHRLNRGGDRRLNWAPHTIALGRMAHDPDTKAYIAKRVAEGKTKREAMRCLKRYLTRSLHRTLENSPAMAA